MNRIFLCAASCINRNIVECKALKESSSLLPSLVLIETLWNVKEVAFVHALDTEAY